MKKNEDKFAVINALRNKVANLVEKAYTLNQAVKALQGITCDEELKALGLESFALANVCKAWAADLKVESAEGGKPQLALYTSTPVTVTVTIDGEPVEKNAYERTEGKKGIRFKALKVRTLQVPEKWTPSIIVEGLVQSRELALAKMEAEVSEMHRDNVLRDGAYIKVTERDAEGGMSVHYEKA